MRMIEEIVWVFLLITWRLIIQKHFAHYGFFYYECNSSLESNDSSVFPVNALFVHARSLNRKLSFKLNDFI